MTAPANAMPWPTANTFAQYQAQSAQNAAGGSKMNPLATAAAGYYPNGGPVIPPTATQAEMVAAWQQNARHAASQQWNYNQFYNYYNAS